MVEILLNAGADVHANCDEALWLASKNGHTEVVRVLLEAGADVHAEDGYALQMASEWGHAEIIDLLNNATGRPVVVRRNALSS